MWDYSDHPNGRYTTGMVAELGVSFSPPSRDFRSKIRGPRLSTQGRSPPCATQASMNPDPILAHQVSRDEGRSPVVYKDSKGLWTIGDGILVDYRVKGAGLLPEEMDFILNNRLSMATNIAAHLVLPSVWLRMSPPRRRVLANMAHNLGLEGLRKFSKMLLAINDMDYVRAAAEMRASLWYTEVGERAERLTHTMKTGEEEPC